MKLFFSFTLLLFSFSCSESVERKIMSSIVKNYHLTHGNTSYVSKVFINEYSKLGENYVSFNDGIYYFIYYGENYEYPLSNYALISDNIRKITSKDEYIYNTRNITDKYSVPVNNLIDIANISEISDMPFYHTTYSIIRRMETKGPLSEKYYTKFDYKIIESNGEVSSISFEPSDNDFSSLNGTIFYNNKSLGIDSINVICNTFENVINDWTSSMYDIIFKKNGEVKSIKMKSYVAGMDITRNMKFIVNSKKDVDITKFDLAQISYFMDNKLIIYNDTVFNNFTSFFDDEYNNIFESFGGSDKVKADFLSNNNTFFINKNYQNKNENFESKLKLTDSISRCLLDSIYDVRRVNYKYNQAVNSFEYKMTDLKIINKAIDLGEVKKDTLISTEFKITNSGENKLYLFDINLDCDCTSYSLNKNGINKLDTLTITLKYNTKGKIGKNRTSVIFQANTEERIHKISLLLEIKN